MFSINKEKLFLNIPYELGNVCKVYQRKINDVYDDEKIGSNKYHYYVSLLTMDEDDLQEILKKKGIQSDQQISVFDYLLLSAEYDKDFFLDLKDAFTTFIQEKVLISTKSKLIIVGDPKDRRTINEQTFYQFQQIIRAYNRMKTKDPIPEDETPMQRKFRLKREQREKVKQKKQAESGETIDMADILSSLCAAGIGYTPFNIGDLTIYQAKELLERLQAYEQYHTELGFVMAGADSKKIKPKNYIRNLTNDN